MITDKTILVTGGAGFVGTHLCKALVANNRVISLDDYSAGSKDNHIDGVEYRQGHTRDIGEHIPETPDIVFHLGEYSRVEQSFDDIDTVLESNMVGTKSVLEFCRQLGSCKLVYAGSSTKFADDGAGKNQSPYAWSKAINTELVRNYGKWFSLDHAITYFYNVYGPGERGNTQNGTVIGIFKEQYEQNRPLTVRSPGTQRRNFTHVDDIVSGLVLVGEKGSGDEYGLGNPDSYSILEVAEMFGGEVEMLPERPGNRTDSSVDARRAMDELGWKPTRDLPSYIEEAKVHAKN